MLTLTIFACLLYSLNNQTASGLKVVKGTKNYIKYFPGNMNLIITAPHGGRLRPGSIPSRKKGHDVNLIPDSYTLNIAKGIIRHIEKITGQRPHLVYSNLHRSRLDPNREENVAAQGNPQAVTAYREYHDTIRQAKRAAAPAYLTVSSKGAAASGQPNRMGRYHLTEKINNNQPVYKKEDNSQFMFVNDRGEWVVFHEIHPTIRSLRNADGNTATPPRDGWQFWNRDSRRWEKDSRLKMDSPSALLLDIHGQAHGKNSSELGYLITKSQLNAGVFFGEQTSIRSLIQRTGIPVDEILYGRESFGAMFEDAGYKAVPSPRKPNPGRDKYFRGGFTIQEHGSRFGGSVDAIQIEAPGEVRLRKTQRDRFTLDLAKIIQRFYKKYYEKN